MLRSHGTSERWLLPTPFRDSAGGRITIPINRPTLRAIVLLVPLAHLTETALAWSELQHRAAVAYPAYTLCVSIAAILSRALGARGWPGIGDRPTLVCASTFLLPGLWLDGGPSTAAPLFAISAVLALTLGGEVGYRLTTGRIRRSGGAAR